MVKILIKLINSKFINKNIPKFVVLKPINKLSSFLKNNMPIRNQNDFLNILNLAA